MSPTASPQTVYDEMMDFEKRCNNRDTSLNSYLVLYETRNEKDEPVIKKTTMLCPTAMHVVIRFPTCVKLELLSDGYVSIAPIISAPRLGEETDPEIVLEDVRNQPMEQVLAQRAEAQAAPQPVPAHLLRRIPLIAGLGLCRVCKHSPFTNPARICTGKGHRFDKDPANKRCEQFEFP
jgi:hypothetical protein